MPAPGQIGAVAHAVFGGIAQRLGAVAVHQALAGDEPHVARERLGEQRIDRGRMHGAEHARARCAVTGELVEEKARRFGGDRGVGVTGLDRIGVPLEPFEQPRRGRRDDVDLRQMDVRVDEIGRDDAAGEVEQVVVAFALFAQRRELAARHDAAPVDQQQPALDHARRAFAAQRIVGEVEQRVAQRGTGHDSRASAVGPLAHPAPGQRDRAALSLRRRAPCRPRPRRRNPSRRAARR